MKKKKLSDDEVDLAMREIVLPVLEQLIAQHGPKEAERRLRQTAVAMGWDPMMWRIVMPEDVS
jgi:hypothetical protein